MSNITYEGVGFTLDIPEDSLQMESTKIKVDRIWKCPCCKYPYKTKSAMYDHMYKEHSNEIPENMSAAQYAFNIRNKKTFGLCVQCRTNHTPWDEDAERYDRFCGPQCRNAYVVEAKRRMVKKYGKEHLLDDPKFQLKMQDGRSIAGQYEFPDKTLVPYLGSYEYDFLHHLDSVYSWNGTEVLRCTETFEYEYEGKTHIYMPDYILPNFNLIVEIKDGGDNPNMHHKIQNVDKVKEKLKDEVMRNQTKFNYIKIVNKEYQTFNFLIKAITDMAWDDPEFKGKVHNIIMIP